MISRLKSHPDTPPRFIRDITADVTRDRDGDVIFRYVVTGATGNLTLPSSGKSGRADDLWQNTCFEAFIRLGGEAYLELNFSPSGQWAAYRFDGRRKGMRNLETIRVSRIRAVRGEGRYDLRASVDLSGLTELKPDAPWRMGLTAVAVESARSTYWALAHGAGKPDFHDPATFQFDLPPPESK